MFTHLLRVNRVCSISLVSHDDRYPLKDGVQVTAIYNMIQWVMGES